MPTDNLSNMLTKSQLFLCDIHIWAQSQVAQTKIARKYCHYDLSIVLAEGHNKLYQYLTANNLLRVVSFSHNEQLWSLSTNYLCNLSNLWAFASTNYGSRI